MINRWLGPNINPNIFRVNETLVSVVHVVTTFAKPPF